MTRALIFDLDGTLIDSAPDIAAALNAVMRDEGQAEFSLPEVISFVGKGAPHLLSLAMAARGLDPADHARLLGRLMDYYTRSHAHSRFFPGVRAALERWQSAGVIMGLCTNKPYAATTAVLAHFDMAGFFQVVVGGDSLATRKPDPLMLTHVHGALGGGAALYLGDSEVDAATAQAAGLPFALFTKGYRKSPVDQIPHDQSFDDWAGFAAGFQP